MIRHIFRFVILAFFTGMLASCEQKITTKTKVSEDGSLERVILFEAVDSVKAEKNIFGINGGRGWAVSVEKAPKEKNDQMKATEKDKFNITFTRKFNSAAESNQVLDSDNDSVFHIHSSFERKFRWFYTYLEFSDTYKAINRFKSFPKEEYFTKEDFDFLRRLPADGESISNADSVYLDQLTEKIYGHYALKALFEDHYNLVRQAIGETDLDKSWLDSLAARKGELFSLLQKAEEHQDVYDKPFMLALIDTVDSGFPIKMIEEKYVRLFEQLAPRLRFMTETAAEAKFTHVLEIPYSLVESNADSVAGNTLTWKPLLIKFTLEDYKMHAVSRKPNYWAFVVSIIVVGLTGYLFMRKRAA